MGEYDDIINHEHHITKKHPRMSIEDRAAQFGAFDALTGLKGIIGQRNEELNYVEKIELSEELQEKISDTIQMLEVGDLVKIKYYKNNQYWEIENKVQKIDIIKKKIILANDIKINVVDIFELLKS